MSGTRIWKPFQRFISEAKEPHKTRLIEAARAWAGFFRSARAENDPDSADLHVDLSRGGNGFGIAVTIRAARLKKRGFTPETMSVSNDGTRYYRGWDRTSLLEEMRTWFDRLEKELPNPPDVPFGLWLVLKKAGPKGEPRPE
jgi:hypothetical protein